MSHYLLGTRGVHLHAKEMKNEYQVDTGRTSLSSPQPSLDFLVKKTITNLVRCHNGDI